jgi:hypothetical protein
MTRKFIVYVGIALIGAFSMFVATVLFGRGTSLAIPFMVVVTQAAYSFMTDTVQGVTIKTLASLPAAFAVSYAWNHPNAASISAAVIGVALMFLVLWLNRRVWWPQHPVPLQPHR